MKKLTDFFMLEEILYTIFVFVLILAAGMISYRYLIVLPLLLAAGVFFFGVSENRNGEKSRLLHAPLVTVILCVLLIMAKLAAVAAGAGSTGELLAVAWRGGLLVFAAGAFLFALTYLFAWLGFEAAERFQIF